jgi:flavin-dependent dehydrogenase
MNKYQAVIIGFGKAGKTLAVTLAKAGVPCYPDRPQPCFLYQNQFR